MEARDDDKFYERTTAVHRNAVRQRVDASGGGSSALFVDTAPRPVRPNMLLRPKSTGPRQATAYPPTYTPSPNGILIGAVVSVVLLLTGLALITDERHAVLQQRVNNEYYKFVEAWQATYLKPFRATNFTLIIGVTGPLGKNVTFPLAVSELPTKRARDPDLPGAIGQSVHVTHWVAHTTARTRPVHKHQRALPKYLWRQMQTGLSDPYPFWLLARDGATGRETQIKLGDFGAARFRTVPGGVNEVRCQQLGGTTLGPNKCRLFEYLHDLCFKVSRDAATGAYSLDNSTGGGPGCWGGKMAFAPDRWAGINFHGQMFEKQLYLPAVAANSTYFNVRHTDDPEIRERVLMHEFRTTMDPRVARHALGTALAFLGFALLIPICLFGAPMALAYVRRLRGGKKKADAPLLPVGAAGADSEQGGIGGAPLGRAHGGSDDGSEGVAPVVGGQYSGGGGVAYRPRGSLL